MDFLELNNALDNNRVAQILWRETREGMAFVDHDGVMRKVNPRFADLLGYAINEIEGKTFAEITIGSDQAADLVEFEKLLRGEQREYSMVKSYNTKDRSVITVRLRAVDVQTGILVLGQILPVDTLSLEQLPDSEAHRVLSQLIGKWVYENRKKVFMAFLAILGVVRIDNLIALFS